VSEAVPVCAIDANVILRYILRDDPELSETARSILRGIETAATRVLCDPVTLSEVVYVLASYYGMPRERISAGLLDLLREPGFLMPDKDLCVCALELFGKSVPHFGDACACAAALQECDGRLYSFDKKLTSVEGITRFERPAKAE
jgi:predicted nucleic acid-binding protein